MPDYVYFGKPRLSRGFSFPLKRSIFDTFLDNRQITMVTGMSYVGPSRDNRVLSADYHGPRNRGMSHTLNIRVNAVPSNIRHHVAVMFEIELLPRLASWITQFVDRSKLASQIDHKFEVYYDEVTADGVCRIEVRIDTPRS